MQFEWSLNARSCMLLVSLALHEAMAQESIAVENAVEKAVEKAG